MAGERVLNEQLQKDYNIDAVLDKHGNLNYLIRRNHVKMQKCVQLIIS